MNKRNTNIVACFLILEKDNQVLLLKRANTGYRDGEYGLVAGHLEPGETFTQAMVREAREEAGLEFTEDELEVVHVMHRKSTIDQSERVDVFFVPKHFKQKPINCEPEKCSELKWFDSNKLPKNIIPPIKQALESYVKKESYSEWGWRLSK
ncbi:MAG: NUDIX domain-containing protein [Patescibacteria group bacterium]|nr:NUDIX domain-containing protein [Patescibacteria group bacterium]